MRFSRFLKFTTLTLLMTGALVAGDYDGLLKVVLKSKPQWKSGAAMCSLDMNQLALLDLTDAAKAMGLNLVVLNVAAQKDIEPMLQTMLRRKPDFIILMDEDPLLGVKTNTGSRIIKMSIAYKIPTLSITQAGLKLGALFAVGPDTQGKVLGNAQVAAKLGVSLPETTD